MANISNTTIDLEGLGVIVTRPEGQGESLASLIETHNGTPFLIPALAITDSREDKRKIRNRLKNSHQYDYLLFTSPNSVTYAIKYGLTFDHPEVGLIAIGTGTANALKEHTEQPVLQAPKPYTSEALIAALEREELNGEKILLISGEGGRRILGDSLRDDYGAETEYLDLYRRIKPSSFPFAEVEQFPKEHPLLLLITSQEALTHIDSALIEAGLKSKITAVIVGSERLRKHTEAAGYSTIIVAPSALDADMWQAIVEFYHNLPKYSQEASSSKEAAQHNRENGAHSMDEKKEKAPTERKEQIPKLEAEQITTDDVEVTLDDESSQQIPPTKGGGAIGGLALVVALTATALSGYQYYDTYFAKPGRAATKGYDKTKLTELGDQQILLKEQLSQLTTQPSATELLSPLKAEIALLKEQLANPTEQQGISDRELTTLMQRTEAVERQQTQLLEQLMQQQQSTTVLTDSHTALQKELSQVKTLLQEYQGEQIAYIDEALKNQTEAQTAAITRAEELVKSIDRNHDLDALALSEVEYLLNLAQYKLSFEQNPSAALQALTEADRRLEQLTHLNFSITQERLAHRITLLDAIVQTPIAEISAHIDAVSQHVQNAALLLDPTVAELQKAMAAKEQEKGKRWHHAITDALAPLFVVGHERIENPDFIHQDDQFMINQNIQLQLSSARVALLRNEPQVFKESLTLARQWVAKYYAEGDRHATEALVALDGLLALELTPEYPDLTPVINAFNAARTLHEQGGQ